MKSAQEKYRHKSNWRRIFILNNYFIQTVELDESGRIIKKQRDKPKSNREKMKIYLGKQNDKKEENKNQIDNDEKQKEDDIIEELKYLSRQEDDRSYFNFDQLDNFL